VFAHGRTTGFHSFFISSALKRQAVMYDPSNPYASPMASAMDPIAVQWLGTPSPSLRKVANGLGMIYAGICLAILSAIGGAILSATSRGNLDTLALIGILLVIAFIVSAILNIVGTLFCLATPEESGAKGMIYASAAAMGLSLLISFAIRLHVIPPPASIVQMILTFISGVTFLVFLRRLSLFIGRQDLAKKARSILIWCVGLVMAVIIALALMISSVGMAYVRALATGQRPQVGRDELGSTTLPFLILGVVAVAGFITFLRDANLLTYTRKAILSGGATQL
jgi:hypothetical protein